jgi:uncharacterized protein (DUF924 family)
MQHPPEDILHFWFDEIPPSKWWIKSAAFDGLIDARFGGVHRAAARCELFEWRKTPGGRLAEIIVLDQFSRNIHRDTGLAFACDPLALALAQEAIAAGADRQVDEARRVFFYMPYMHSESRRVHEVAVLLFKEAGLTDNLAYELRHKTIIDRFDRFPHRNAALGRISTPAEIEFLKAPGSAF